VLYEPDINLIVQSINQAQDVIMADNQISSSSSSPNAGPKGLIDLAPAIAQSR
jgi:hypothetical protein